MYIIKRLGMLFLIFFAVGCASSRKAGPDAAGAVQADTTIGVLEAMPLIENINDPIEPFNRGVWGFNKGFFNYFIYPINTGYNFIVPEPARKALARMGLNLKYPVHLVNTLLQGKFRGARDETGRFLINTTIGILGLFDPATNRFNIQAHREDFGQTFGYYGGKPKFYLVIPFLGPSSGRDAVGRLLDFPLDLSSWLAGAGTFFQNNDIAMKNDMIKNILQREADTYTLMRNVWSVDREKDVRDYEPKMFPGDPEPSLESLFLAARDPKFFKRGKTRKVTIPGTGRKLPYTYWIQKERSPLVLILPGLGSHRIAKGPVALAEMAYRNGYSVIVMSSSMNWEFMENAASAPVPGYPLQDCIDIVNALDLIRNEMRERYSDRVSSAAVMGYSLGGIHALHIAALEAQDRTRGITFDRYLSLNPPVSMEYALGQLDDYFNAPLRWDAETRVSRMENLFLKVAYLGHQQLKPSSEIPLTRNESDFLIGLAFRYTLRDVIYTGQRRDNLGILKSDLTKTRRQPAYVEIRNYSYADYMSEFALPYFLNRPERRDKEFEPQQYLDLRTIEKFLKGNNKIRVHMNVNDFLIRPQDVKWLESTFGDQLVLFEEGGHLGNLYKPEIQDRIMQSLNELRDL